MHDQKASPFCKYAGCLHGGGKEPENGHPHWRLLLPVAVGGALEGKGGRADDRPRPAFPQSGTRRAGRPGGPGGAGESREHVSLHDARESSVHLTWGGSEDEEEGGGGGGGGGGW
ncbi:unnamed protein product [Prorocentrum cordatum]|uniref:Uncharacterized protein n=1 Tax=Prorocentrum cordatum TaxID=2364126 RepID=A0ABN9V254_9DINO|nr:unnamed protein product [Polarella glacialis]